MTDPKKSLSASLERKAVDYERLFHEAGALDLKRTAARAAELATEARMQLADIRGRA